MIHLHTEGSRAASRAGDGLALPPPRVLRRPERARRGERGSGRLRPGLPVGRAAPVRDARGPARHGARQRDPAGCTRVLLARRLGGGDAQRHSCREHGHRAVQPGDAAGPSARASSTSARSTWRPRWTSRRTAHEPPTIGEVERRIGAFVADLVPDGATLQLGIGTIPAATALALVDKRDLGVHTEMFSDSVVDLVEAGVITGALKERNRGKIVTAFVARFAARLRLHPRQPDGRDARGRLHQRSARHPVLSPDGRRSTRRSRWTSPVRSWPTRSARGSTAASVGRWTSSVAPPWPMRVGRSSPCHPRRPVGQRHGSSTRSRTGLAW